MDKMEYLGSEGFIDHELQSISFLNTQNLFE
jgi:hypothetical protein